ncbi:MAG: alcohol dehydrogenase [Candidatus Syntrophonatronum acetioxidans]|uniref:Alcohol dehydrogenase n=1 Tax=Candidatus Syntrophonatronum acetioxidans TaxID=1795816 RepID=A0A424YGS7_9FIRM|nr:MAG: alcohol dehydrogenase [Candidatus Syntrophonatronum acetioxidans]
MKAAVLEKINKINLTEVEIPSCGAGEVLLKVEACGVCRTDMKSFTRGQRDLKLPRVLGHEIAGTVLKKGEGVENIKAGDRVQVSPGITCGKCEYCLQGRDNLCSHLQIMGFNYHGGFSQYLLVPSRGVKNNILHKIPSHLTFEEATMTEPLACCLNMQESLQVKEGDTVLILGGGRLGILNARLARARGAGPLVLVEPREERISLAEKMGFDYSLNPLKTHAQEEIMNITRSKGADVVIPCCPHPEAFNLGLHVAAKGSRFGYFSGLTPDKTFQVDLNLVHYKELQVVGGYGCSINHNRRALELLSRETVTVKDILTRFISLEEIEKGLKMIENMTELAVTVRF